MYNRPAWCGQSRPWLEVEVPPASPCHDIPACKCFGLWKWTTALWSITVFFSCLRFYRSTTGRQSQPWRRRRWRRGRRAREWPRRPGRCSAALPDLTWRRDSPTFLQEYIFTAIFGACFTKPAFSCLTACEVLEVYISCGRYHFRCCERLVGFK